MCSYCVSNKFIRPFQLYIYLKLSCSGRRKIEKEDLRIIADAIGLKSERAVRNNLKLLLKANWIGYDRRTGNYFIRGFEKVKAICNFTSRTGAEFNIGDIKSFKAFIGAAVIGYLVNSQRRRKWGSERYKGGSLHLPRNASNFLPVAATGLSKILRISISTASLLRKNAADEGYIKVEKKLSPTGVGSNLCKEYKKTYPEKAHLVRIFDNKLYLQGVDHVLPILNFKRRKKSKHI